MKSIKKILGLFAIAFILCITPISVEANDDIIPYGPIGACDVCGYSSASVAYSYGGWYTIDYIQHHGHIDEKQGRNKYATVSCPNCGSVKKYSMGVEERIYCPY